MNVAVLGASRKTHRYSYKAIKLLGENGHRAFPVHPILQDIDGDRVYASLADIEEPIDVVSVYLSAKNSDNAAEDILNSGARRVIFNPGAENPDLAKRLTDKDIEPLEACTLVLLKTGQFDF